MSFIGLKPCNCFRMSWLTQRPSRIGVEKPTFSRFCRSADFGKSLGFRTEFTVFTHFSHLQQGADTVLWLELEPNPDVFRILSTGTLKDLPEETREEESACSQPRNAGVSSF